MGGSGRKCWSLVRKAMWEAFELLARLHSWVAGQDTVRTARRMPNAKTDALLFYLSFPFFFSPCLLLCLCLFPSSHSIFILYIPPCRRAAFMLPSSWILSYIFNSLSELIFSVSVYPFAFLSHCAIADTVFFQLSILQKEEECMCVCVHLHVRECIYSCLHLCVCLCIG